VIDYIGPAEAKALVDDLDIREGTSLGRHRLASSVYVGYGPLQPHCDKHDRPGAPCLVYVIVGKPTRLVPPFPARSALG
jgi:hypothetical protein